MTRLTIKGQAIQVNIHAQDGPGLSTNEIDTFLEEGKGGFTVEELEAAFDAVKDGEHWKNPIDAEVGADMQDVLDKAIPWFTGTTAAFHQVEGKEGMIRVTAPGYFAGPCN